MAIQHYTVVVANSPTARAAVYGSVAEFQFFGNVLANAVPCPISGNVWGKPLPSGNAPPLYVWGLWSSMDPGTLLSKLQTLAAASTVQLFTWDDSTEAFGAYLARWQLAAGWTPAADPTVGASAI